MEQAAFKKVQYGGMTISIPEIWDVETDELQEFDGQTSYSISITASGNDARSIDLSFGPLPEGSNAYAEAWGAYEEVVGEEGLKACSEDDEPILCFDFKGMLAHGFSLVTEENLPCFFFCMEIPQQDPSQTNPTQEDQSKLLTVILRAAGNEELQSLLDFVEKYLCL